MKWRELISVIYASIQDPGAMSANFVPDLLHVQFCELAINLVLMQSRTKIDNVAVTINSGPINYHATLPNVSMITDARGSNGRRINRIGFNLLTGIEDAFSRAGPAQDFYTLGATVFGTRPIQNEQIVISVVPYEHVWSLDLEIPVSNDYQVALEHLIASLVLGRLGFYERAAARFDDGLAALDNVKLRFARSA